ncbi:MAG: hypothetical protein E7C03_07440 [Anaerococcus sp.]|nr:hypothetical protein [Anaerococcus sp.]
MSIAPSGVTSFTVVPSGSLSRFVTLSVKSTFPPFSTSSLETSGSYLSASFCAGVVFVAVAVIVALYFVIAVPAGVDHTGFSYPSFAVTAGYLSAVNAVPLFTSYTLLFAMSFTPSPFVNVTLTYPSGVGLFSSPVLSMMSSNLATLIFAVALSVDLSG